jgi:hypothetical protein
MLIGVTIIDEHTCSLVYPTIWRWRTLVTCQQSAPAACIALPKHKPKNIASNHFKGVDAHHLNASKTYDASAVTPSSL